jgi:hypothetical protein
MRFSRSIRRAATLAAFAAALTGAAFSLAGCAASNAGAGRASGTPVVDLRMRRSLEQSGSRGQLRVLGSELRVELRPAGQSRGADGGVLTLGGATMTRSIAGKGDRVSHFYTLPEADLDRLTRAGADGWADLVATGGPGFPAFSTRVRLAPALDVLRPSPGAAIPRNLPLEVRVIGLPAGLWARVSIGDGAVTASDRGQGFWEIMPADLVRLASGPARLRIEVETSCDGCVSLPEARVRWFGRTELDVPLTLL